MAWSSPWNTWMSQLSQSNKWIKKSKMNLRKDLLPLPRLLWSLLLCLMKILLYLLQLILHRKMSREMPWAVTKLVEKRMAGCQKNKPDGQGWKAQVTSIFAWHRDSFRKWWKRLDLQMDAFVCFREIVVRHEQVNCPHGLSWKLQTSKAGLSQRQKIPGSCRRSKQNASKNKAFQGVSRYVWRCLKPNMIKYLICICCDLWCTCFEYFKCLFCTLQSRLVSWMWPG